MRKLEAELWRLMVDLRYWVLSRRWCLSWTLLSVDGCIRTWRLMVGIELNWSNLKSRESMRRLLRLREREQTQSLESWSTRQERAIVESRSSKDNIIVGAAQKQSSRESWSSRERVETIVKRESWGNRQERAETIVKRELKQSPRESKNNR
jgi:hypothetical protein